MISVDSTLSVSWNYLVVTEKKSPISFLNSIICEFNVNRYKEFQILHALILVTLRLKKFVLFREMFFHLGLFIILLVIYYLQIVSHFDVSNLWLFKLLT